MHNCLPTTIARQARRRAKLGTTFSKVVIRRKKCPRLNVKEPKGNCDRRDSEMHNLTVKKTWTLVEGNCSVVSFFSSLI